MHLRKTKKDEAVLKEKLKSNGLKKNLKKNIYKNKIVKKPWGFEYIFWSNKNVAFWVLMINPKQSTSMHSHILKKTYLINTSKIILNNLRYSKKINSFSTIEIDKSTFHQTVNFQKKKIVMFEIETPNNKSDLLRYKDKYNRNTSIYETETLNSLYASKQKKSINKKYLEIYKGEKNKKNISLKKGSIVILISGSLNLMEGPLKKIKPFKVKQNQVLKSNYSLKKNLVFIVIKNVK